MCSRLSAGGGVEEAVADGVSQMLQMDEDESPLAGTWRALQSLLGSPEARSTAERQEVERAANREPWVHEVGAPIASCCPLHGFRGAELCYLGCADKGTCRLGAWCLDPPVKTRSASKQRGG